MSAARKYFIEAVNRKQMETQLAGWDKARGLRAYADRVAAAVAADADPERTAQSSGWLRRILEA